MFRSVKRILCDLFRVIFFSDMQLVRVLILFLKKWNKKNSSLITECKKLGKSDNKVASIEDILKFVLSFLSV